MSDECLAKPCSTCGERITGANYYCPECKLCFCFGCSTELAKKAYPVICPKCGRRLL